jgi:hypothetical protein
MTARRHIGECMSATMVDRLPSQVYSHSTATAPRSVYAHDTQHSGVLHYLIHACDDPVHAETGLAAARAYAKTAAAVPHACHMPSHIFTRPGYARPTAAEMIPKLERICFVRV